MARKLRKKRIAAAVLLLVLLIGGICFLVFRGCSRGESGQSTDAGGNTVTGGGTAANGTEDSGTQQTTSALMWPAELSDYVKEYNGAGSMVGASSSQNEEGKTVYKVQYKGTTVDSCFAYAKDTLDIDGEWTEVVTGEHYTLARETDTCELELSCEPKAQNGYDLQITVTIK